MSAAAQPEPLVTIFREYRALRSAHDAPSGPGSKFGKKADERSDVLCRQWLAIYDRMSTIRAEGLAGVLVKLRAHVQHALNDDEVLASAISDLERLSNH